MPLPFTEEPPLETIPIPEGIAISMRDHILQGDDHRLLPGMMVTEATVIGMYGKSRQSCRDAIFILLQQGWLIKHPNHSAVVPELPQTELKDILRARTPLVQEAVATLAARDQFYLAEPTPAPTDLNLRIAAHVEFLNSLVDAVGNSRLSKVFQLLANDTHMCLRQNGLCLTALELDGFWEAITNAVNLRDMAAAASAMDSYAKAEAALAA